MRENFFNTFSRLSKGTKNPLGRIQIHLEGGTFETKSFKNRIPLQNQIENLPKLAYTTTQTSNRQSQGHISKGLVGSLDPDFPGYRQQIDDGIGPARSPSGLPFILQHFLQQHIPRLHLPARLHLAHGRLQLSESIITAPNMKLSFMVSDSSFFCSFIYPPLLMQRNSMVLL